MLFGNNSLVVRNDERKWEYTFDTREALRGVRLGELEEGDGAVKVGYAKEWLQSRYVPSRYQLMKNEEGVDAEALCGKKVQVHHPQIPCLRSFRPNPSIGHSRPPTQDTSPRPTPQTCAFPVSSLLLDNLSV